MEDKIGLCLLFIYLLTYYLCIPKQLHAAKPYFSWRLSACDIYILLLTSLNDIKYKFYNLRKCVFQIRTSFLPAVGMEELDYLALLNLLLGGWGVGGRNYPSISRQA